MVSFGYIKQDGDWRHLCGGSIISDRSIITAAHCFTNEQVSGYPKLQIRMGDDYLNTAGEETDMFAQTYDIGGFKKHPRYDYHQTFDIALVVTDRIIEYNNVTKPICLPKEPKENGDSESGKLVWFTGWGFDTILSNRYRQRQNDSLNEAQFSIFPKEKCKAYYRTYDQYHFCAGNEVQ